MLSFSNKKLSNSRLFVTILTNQENLTHQPKGCKHDILLNRKTSVCTLFTDESRILELLAKGAASQEILKEYPEFEPND